MREGDSTAFSTLQKARHKISRRKNDNRLEGGDTLRLHNFKNVRVEPIGESDRGIQGRSSEREHSIRPKEVGQTEGAELSNRLNAIVNFLKAPILIYLPGSNPRL